MASPVFSMMTNNIDDLYTQGRIRHRIEDHLARLIAGSTIVPLEDHHRNRYEYDFYNLLQVLGYPNSSHYAILRVNDYTHPHQFTVDREALIIPEQDDIRWLHDIHRLYQKYGQVA